jgi:hypothetical protein
MQDFKKGWSMEEKKNINCWEFKECGRESGGKFVYKSGECPAATATKADGIHNGINGGRCCWVVAGTFCKGEVQGSFAKKFSSCQQCDFYALVREQEYPNFKQSVAILQELDELEI